MHSFLPFKHPISLASSTWLFFCLSGHPFLSSFVSPSSTALWFCSGFLSLSALSGQIHSFLLFQLPFISRKISTLSLAWKDFNTCNWLLDISIQHVKLNFLKTEYVIIPSKCASFNYLFSQKCECVCVSVRMLWKWRWRIFLLTFR